MFFPNEVQQDRTTIRMRQIPGHFDPFVDQVVNIGDNLEEADITVPAIPSIQNDESRGINGFNAPDINKVSSNTAFMTDEGPAFPEVAAAFGWNHILNRKHLAQQILTS